MNTKRTKTIFRIHVMIIIVVGFCYIYWTWSKGMAETENHAMVLAQTAEVSFQSEMIKILQASSKDLNNEDYYMIKDNLIKLVKINKELRFAYIYKRINNKIYFLADSEPVNSKSYSPPGQEYNEADKFTYQATELKHAILTKPAMDRWGTWVSVLVPITDPDTGKTIAVFGIDYPAKDWCTKTLWQTVQSGIVVLFMLLLLTAFNIIYLKKYDLEKEKLKLAKTNQIVSEQEILFRTIYEQSPLGITFGDSGCNIINANKKFEQIVQRSKDELSHLSWMDITHPDDVQRNVELFDQLQLGENDGYNMIKRYLRPDGTECWVNMTVAPLKVEGKTNITHICSVEDITERVQTNEYLRESERNNAMLLSNLPGMAYRCTIDKNYTIEFVSEGCLSLTGYCQESMLHNKVVSFNDLIDMEYLQIKHVKWANVLKEKNIFQYEYPITTASGEIKWVYEQGQGVYNDQGEPIAIEGMIIDISDRKMREDEISYMYHHDSLTGLYNRRYLDEEKQRLDKEEYYPLSIIIGDINGLKLINSTMGHDVGDALIQNTAEILSQCCRDGDILARTGGDEFSILMPNSGYEDAYALIRKIDRLCEVYQSPEDAYNISIAMGCATKRNRNINFSSMIKDAEESMYRHKLLQNKSPHSAIISSMKSTLYEKSQETEEHAHRLIQISKTIGKNMHLVEEQLNELELLSTLHDIGKIGISDGILNKPGKLSSDEWDEMKKHPEMGYRIAMSTPELAPIADYILCHHERWDGTGYPHGLRGEAIPLLSRIIAVADAYDAMTSDRPYRKAMDQESALNELKENAGTQFDPNIVEIFLIKSKNIT